MDTITHDFVVIGAGLGGLVFLRNALRRGLKGIALEKQSSVGGIWNKLPAWQDLQTFPADWPIHGTELNGIRQPEVLDNLRQYAQKHGLESVIRLNSEVKKADWSAKHQRWTVTTTSQTYQARYLVCATGPQARPFIPKIPRSNLQLTEAHSMNLENPETLRNQVVTVVGAGASALDLLDLCFLFGAQKVQWLYRKPRWFFPTTKEKGEKVAQRLMAFRQMQGVSIDQMTTRVQKVLDEKYKYFEIEEIKPADPFDYCGSVLIPGRRHMLKNFKKISRHVGQIERVAEKTVFHSGGHLETDVLLYGTGYKIDLSFLGLDELKKFQSGTELAMHSKSYFLDSHYPNLLYMGFPLGESNSNAPASYSIVAQTLVSHIKGVAKLSNDIPDRTTNHWDLMKFFSKMDRASYPPLLWKPYFLAKAYLYHKNSQRQINLF